MQWSLAFLPGSCFSLDSLSYVVLAPAEHLMTVNHNPRHRVQYPKPEPQFPIPTHHGGCAASIVSAGKCWSTMILVMNYLHFNFWSSVVFPSKVLKPSPHPPRHPIPTNDRDSKCVKTCSFSWLPPWSKSPHLKLFAPLFSYIFCPTSCSEYFLPAFKNCSVRVVPHADAFFILL